MIKLDAQWLATLLVCIFTLLSSVNDDPNSKCQVLTERVASCRDTSSEKLWFYKITNPTVKLYFGTQNVLAYVNPLI